MSELNMNIVRGQIVSFRDDPMVAGEENCLQHWSKGAIVVDEFGKIAWRGDFSNLPNAYANLEETDYGDKLILPGFIDAHLHFPQYRMLAAYATDLLDWLNRYTFIEEQRYGDKAIADAAAKMFVDELFRHGITSCLAFSTIHTGAADALFEEASRRNMSLITGRTMMDRNAPSGLRDSAEKSYDETRELIGKWTGKSRLGYAISPRFAVTSTEEQLELAGALVKEYPDLWMQTHLSENHGEIAAVARDFPWSKDYTDVYDRYGLLREKSYFAHGIHLNDRELARLSDSGSAIVHCPTSNNFLGSGHFKCREVRNGDNPVKTGIGSDIGGGTSYSTLATLRDAFTVSQLVGARISPYEAFYMSTLGNARVLYLDSEIGSIDVGKYADLVVLDPCATPLMAARHELSSGLSDILFALMIMGDDRAIVETYVAGKRVKTAIV
ncbi:MAG: guanine deaminase [Rhizobiaceae bacterium]|nr:guanine deaminase [Rhizobiaceae bacterium]